VAAVPGIIESERSAVAVGTDDAHRGQAWVVGSGAVEIARSIDRDAFLNRFHEVLDLPRG